MATEVVNAMKLPVVKKSRATKLPAGKKSRLPSIAEEGNKSSHPSQDRNPSVYEAPLVPELGRVQNPTTEVPLPDVTFDDVADYPSSPCFSIHDNRYENSDLQSSNHKEPKQGKSGDDVNPQGMVPHLPYTEYPNLAGTSSSANESIADIIARVTRKTIEDLRREGKSLSDIEDAATQAAKESLKRHSARVSNSKQNDKMIDSDAEEMSEQSSYYSYSSDSSEGSEKKKPRNYRSCYVAKRLKSIPTSEFL